MTISTAVRRGVAAAILTAVPMGAAAVPAHAEPTLVPPGGPGSIPVMDPDNPQVWILDGYRPVGDPIQAVPAGRPVTFDIGFNLAGERSEYTDLTYTTSHPGTETCGPMDAITAGSESAGQGMKCPVTLRALKRGASMKYWVRLNGKRAGKPFSLTSTTFFYAPDVRVKVFLDGKRIDGTTYTVPRSKQTFTLTYLVENRSPETLEGVDVEGYRFCAPGTIKPGMSAACALVMDYAEVDYGTVQLGDLTMFVFGHYAHLPLAKPTRLVAE